MMKRNAGVESSMLLATGPFDAIVTNRHNNRWRAAVRYRQQHEHDKWLKSSTTYADRDEAERAAVAYAIDCLEQEVDLIQGLVKQLREASLKESLPASEGGLLKGHVPT